MGGTEEAETIHLDDQDGPGPTSFCPICGASKPAGADCPRCGIGDLTRVGGVNPYAPPEASLEPPPSARRAPTLLEAVGRALLALVGVALVLVSAGIAFFVTCLATAMGNAKDSVIFPASGLAALVAGVGVGYLFFFRRRRRRTDDPGGRP